MTTTAATSSVLVARAHVRRVERITPAFCRVTLASHAFADLADHGFDTRIKLVFPGPTGRLPDVPAVAEDWYAGWLAMPEAERAPIRTYTVREVLGQGVDTLLVVDFVVHEPDAAGPACRWALAAAPGDVVQVVGPRRDGAPYGGTEFAPGRLRDLLLVADETAVPAVARILADLAPGHRGRVFLEVPERADILALEVPDDVAVRWLPRDGGDHGQLLVEEVRRALGLDPRGPAAGGVGRATTPDGDVWETPRYSAAGEDVESQLARSAVRLGDTYAWVAGESSAVTALRRALVTELGVDRARVAFMGYWRRGVAMRS